MNEEFNPNILKELCDETGFEAILKIKDLTVRNIANKCVNSCFFCNESLCLKSIKCAKCDNGSHLKCLKPSIKKIVLQKGLWFCSDVCMK